MGRCGWLTPCTPNPPAQSIGARPGLSKRLTHLIGVMLCYVILSFISKYHVPHLIIADGCLILFFSILGCMLGQYWWILTLFKGAGW